MALSHYPKDSAGRMLTTKVPTINDDATIHEGRQLLQHSAEQFDTVNYLYLVNGERRLTGVVSIRELLQAPSHEHLQTFSPQSVVTVRPHTDQERVAHVALRSGLKAVPVIDAHERFLGVVSSGAILSTLNHEHTEDVLHFAGVSKRPDPERYLLGGGPLTHVYSRLPWLVIGLIGGIGAAVVVRWFEDALRVQLLLAAFIPVVIYIADAVSAQTQMLYIRASTIAAQLNLRTYIARELVVNVMLGAVLGLLILVVSWWWLLVPVVSTVLGLTVFITVCLVTLIGIGLPWFFYRRGYDPAIASEPITSVVCQLMSLCIYFSIAALFI
ncbi:magnesium transporter [Patescibacteria group bacterium]|nr:magnesium transporter [Patescibacteria group bacterium]